MAKFCFFTYVFFFCVVTLLLHTAELRRSFQPEFFVFVFFSVNAISTCNSDAVCTTLPDYVVHFFLFSDRGSSAVVSALH